MKKKIAILLTACLLLASCKENPAADSTTTTTPETTTTTTTTTAPTNTTTTTTETTTAPVTTTVTTTEEKELLGYFLDYNGEKVYYNEAVQCAIAGVNVLTPEEAEKQDIVFCDYEGFTYGVYSKGNFLNSFDDEFDSDERKFKNVPTETPTYELNKISVGDTYGPLTVTEASCTLVPMKVDNPFPSDLCLIKTDLKYSGEITLTGYVRTSTYGEGYAEDGEIFLYLDEDCMSDIPYIVYTKNENVHEYRTYFNEYFQTRTDIPWLRLGTVYDSAYSSLDLTMIPQRGSGVAHVKVTISDIEMRAGETVFSYIKGKIVNIEEI